MLSASSAWKPLHGEREIAFRARAVPASLQMPGRFHTAILLPGCFAVQVMEQLLALKLRHAGLRDVEDAHAAAGGTRAAGAAAADERPARAGAHHEALSADAAAAASQSLRLLQDWQSALLSLDAWRLWQQQQRKQRERDSQAQVHEDDLEAEGQDQGQKTQPR